MYDPHRLRRNDRRFFTHKGQIIQAKNLSAPFTIEGNKVEAYKEYILKNGLIQNRITFDNIYVRHLNFSSENTSLPISSFRYHNGPLQIPLGQGFHLMVIISEQATQYTIRAFVTTNTLISTTYSNVWYSYYTFFNQSSSDDTLYLDLQSNGVSYFSLVLSEPTYLSESSIFLLKSKYTLQLPAPSE